MMPSRVGTSLRRIVLLMWKEFLELRQDPTLFPVIFVAPLIQLGFLGYAASTDVRNVPVVVADQDRSSASRALIARFDGSPYFTIIDVVSSERHIDRFVVSGEAWMGLAIPSGYGDAIAGGRTASVQIVADGTDSNSATIGLGYATALVSSYAEDLVAAPDGSAVAGGIDPRIRVWFNPQLESRYFMIPGVVALLLLLITTNLSSMAVVREKEIGTLEQLNVTPLGRSELVLGKLLPYALAGLIDVVLVLAISIYWFEVPLRGSLALLVGMCLVYLMTTLGLGLFVSTVSSTQQQAMMTTTFFFLLPMVYLSGFIFPIENMPAIIEPITLLIPLRYFIVILRGIFLKGVGLETLWPQALALTAWGLAILGLAVARSRKTLD
jgi:ABC-2 type transport system permease protein